MKTYQVLFLLLFIMHLATLINVTIFDGEWNGIVLAVSNLLFLAGAVFFGVESRARKKVKGEGV
ncbi:hypothetical protein [Halobacillus litoralis]|uniref:hypothetical protein n=1 Tax=Halobacillus litoralis TaxID=45668 RepID=UPI001CFDE258|nr:hypothetical protein [Halobacillus litoralis]